MSDIFVPTAVAVAAGDGSKMSRSHLFLPSPFMNEQPLFSMTSFPQMSVDLANTDPLDLVLSGRFTWPFHFPAALLT